MLRALDGRVLVVSATADRELLTAAVRALRRHGPPGAVLVLHSDGKVTCRVRR